MNMNAKKVGLVIKLFIMRFSVLGLLALTISACPPLGDPPLPPTSSTQTFLFYRINNGGIRAVDPANPKATPTVVESNPTTGERTIRHATFQSTPPIRISDIHVQTLIYAKGGSIFKVNAMKPGLLTPIRISTETGATTICWTDTFEDFSDSNKSAYLYTLPGQDNKCQTDDDIWKMIKVGMTATDPPIPVMAIYVNANGPTQGAINPLIDPANGALIGFLVQDRNVLNRYDPNFANRSLVTPLAEPVINLSNDRLHRQRRLVDISSDRFNRFMRVGDTLHRYNSATNTLSPPLHTFGSYGPLFGQSDGDDVNLFFIDSGSNIFRVPLDGSGSSTLLVTKPSGLVINWIQLTDNKVIYGQGNIGLGNNVILAVPKGGGDLITLDAVPPPGGYFIDHTAVGVRVYYYVGTDSNGTAKVVNEDGTVEPTIPNASWSDWNSFSTTQKLSGKLTPNRLFLSETQAGPSLGNTILKSVDAITNREGISHGAFPKDIIGINFDGFGDNLLGTGFNYDGPGALGDIFFVNASIENSLFRVTNTPTIDEEKIF